MKKFTKIMLSGLMATSLGACSASKEPIYTSGTYSASEAGFGGDITVTVTVDEYSIKTVEIVGDGETTGVGSKAVEEMPKAILDAQSAEVDNVSGATISSMAIKTAAAAAIAQAKGEVKEVAALSLTDGTYTSTAVSYAEQYGLATAGSMSMTVTIKDNKIENVEVTDFTDTDIIGGMAFPILTEEVVSSQSLNVELVSGATVSSNGYMSALTDAITQAGGADAVAALKAVEVAKPEAQDVTYDTDILVIGAGMAGLSAAIEAADEGANVILLEKNLVYSSSTTRSLGYVVGADTKTQADNGIEDTEEAFYEDICSLYEGEAELDTDLLKVMADNATELNEWLVDQGLEFTGVIHKSEKGERATKRIHTTNGGSTLTSVLVNSAEEKGVQIMMGTPATELIQAEDGSIVGAYATNGNGDKITINAQSTIVCAGSYTNNEELFHELNPGINNIAYACGSGEGDAYRWFVEVGADIVEIPYTQFMYYSYAAAFPEFPEVIPNSPDNPAYDLLLVAGNGERVTAEDNFCFEFTKENWNLGYNEGYAIVDQEFADTYPVLINDVLNTVVPSTQLPFGYKASTAEELAEAVGLDPETVAATVARYNELCDLGEDRDFGKDAQYMNKLEGDLYIIRLPQITTDGYTGARINENAQVIGTDGTPIKGLYAAGSAADGQTVSVNYFGCGTSLLTCGVFGRVAADHAVSTLVK